MARATWLQHKPRSLTILVVGRPVMCNQHISTWCAYITYVWYYWISLYYLKQQYTDILYVMKWHDITWHDMIWYWLSVYRVGSLEPSRAHHFLVAGRYLSSKRKPGAAGVLALGETRETAPGMQLQWRGPPRGVQLIHLRTTIAA